MNAKLFLKKHSSTILTCVGIFGVVATTVTAVKATPRALELIKNEKDRQNYEFVKAARDAGKESCMQIDKLHPLDIVRVAWKCYIPATLVGMSTIACILGANILNKRSQAALASAYAFLDNSYKEYKNKVSELYGDDANNNIREGIAKDKYKDYSNSFTDDKLLYFDEYSGRYFQSTPEDIQKAEYDLNRTLSIDDEACLNDWYEYIGLDPLDHGEKIGWSTGINYEQYWQSWIDFNHTKTVLDDGLECTIISFNQEPVGYFDSYI